MKKSIKLGVLLSSMAFLTSSCLAGESVEVEFINLSDYGIITTAHLVLRDPYSIAVQVLYSENRGELKDFLSSIDGSDSYCYSRRSEKMKVDVFETLDFGSKTKLFISTTKPFGREQFRYVLYFEEEISLEKPCHVQISTSISKDFGSRVEKLVLDNIPTVYRRGTIPIQADNLVLHEIVLQLDESTTRSHDYKLKLFLKNNSANEFWAGDVLLGLQDCDRVYLSTMPTNPRDMIFIPSNQEAALEVQFEADELSNIRTCNFLFNIPLGGSSYKLFDIHLGDLELTELKTKVIQ